MKIVHLLSILQKIHCNRNLKIVTNFRHSLQNNDDFSHALTRFCRAKVLPRMGVYDNLQCFTRIAMGLSCE